jgi:hypothetical protein
MIVPTSTSEERKEKSRLGSFLNNGAQLRNDLA